MRDKATYLHWLCAVYTSVVGERQAPAGVKEGGGRGSVSCREVESLACQLPLRQLADCAQTFLEVHQELVPIHPPMTQ